MAAWPASLPLIALAADFDESAASILIRTEMDAGPAKVRPRYTNEVKRFQFSLILTPAQVVTLETFFTTTITYGSVAFDWLEPRTGLPISLRLINRPGYQSVAHGLWRTNLVLEYMP